MFASLPKKIKWIQNNIACIIMTTAKEKGSEKKSERTEQVLKQKKTQNRRAEKWKTAGFMGLCACWTLLKWKLRHLNKGMKSVVECDFFFSSLE